MNIVIAGCGKIGSAVLESLVMEGHNVTVIDISEDVINNLSNVYDVMGVTGSATDCDALRVAEVASAELFIATTASDELNMLSCFLARKIGAAHTIARIRDTQYTQQSITFMRKQLDISMAINPEHLVAKELYNILSLPSAAKVEHFSRRNFEMIELKLKPDSALAGIPLSRLRNKYSAKFLICVVRRGENTYIPNGNFVLEGGDRIGITATQSEIHKFFKELGLMQKQAKNIMILGGSKTANYLARLLCATGSNVKVIEKQFDICRELSENLPKAVIINADGSQYENLNEEGIQNMDAFVALTGSDEVNMIMSYFARSVEVPTVISKLNRDEMHVMGERLGIECIVTPKRTVADIVMRYARALENSLGSKVETLYRLMEGSAEAIEFIVSEDSLVSGKALKDLKIKENIIIGGIIRDKTPIIPGGNDVIYPNDKVIVISAGRIINDLDDILG